MSRFPGGRRLWAVLAGAALWSGAALAEMPEAEENPAAQALDIVGVKIGMTQDQAKAALRGHLPKHQAREAVSEIRDYPGSRHVSGLLVNTLANLAHSHEVIVVYFSPPPSKQRVIRVARQAYFADADRPSKTAVLQSLDQKYGAASMTTASGQLYWAWNKQGARQTLATEKPCNGVIAEQMLMINAGRKGEVIGPGRSNMDKRIEAAGCALIVGAVLDEQNGIVRKLDTILTDVGFANDAFALLDAHVDALRRNALNDALKRGDQKKPTL